MIWHISNGDGFGSNDELYLNCPAGPRPSACSTINGTARMWTSSNTGISAGRVASLRRRAQRHARSASTSNGALVGSDTAFTFALNQNPRRSSLAVTPTHARFAPAAGSMAQLDDLAVFKAALIPAEIATLAGGMTVAALRRPQRHRQHLALRRAVNYVWTNTSTGASLPWSTGANWQGGAAPASTRGASVQFFTGQTLAGGAIASSNDIAGAIPDEQPHARRHATAAPTTATISGGSFDLLNNGTLMPTVNLTGTSAPTARPRRTS